MGDGASDEQGQVLERGFVVKGRVQGVGFRWWTRTRAQVLGIVGTVRNLPDGSVSVRARAHPRLLEAFEAELRKGPPAARVDAVERVACDLSSGSTDFTIER